MKDQDPQESSKAQYYFIPRIFRRELVPAAVNGGVSAVVSFVIGIVLSVLGWIVALVVSLVSAHSSAISPQVVGMPRSEAKAASGALPSSKPEPTYRLLKVVVVDVKNGKNTFTDPPVAVTLEPQGPEFEEIPAEDGIGSVQVFKKFRVDWIRGGKPKNILNLRDASVVAGSSVKFDNETHCAFKFEWLTSNDLTDDLTEESRKERKTVLLIRYGDYGDSNTDTCSFP